MKKNNTKKGCFSWLLSLVLFLALAGTSFAAGGNRAVTVDANDFIGVIRSLQGHHFDPGPKGGAVSDRYIEIGVDSIRTHDAGHTGPETSGVGDIDGIGPDRIFPDMNADPTDPASYNFGPTDALVQNILDTGSTVFWRHGRTNAPGNGAIPADPAEFQAFLDKYAEITKRVIMHYNKGWANGFYKAIKYFELWNEPDLFVFWEGTPEQYREFYKRISVVAKQTSPWMQVGGPSNATINDLTGLEETFLEFVRDNHLPLDFYSYHQYTLFSDDPLDNTRLAQRFRAMLDDYGFYGTKIMNTEWGSGFFVPLGPADEAAFCTDSIIYMQDSPVDKAYIYFPMMDEDAVLSKKGHAFKALSSLKKTPWRLNSTGADTAGFGVLAGRGLFELRVVISNYEIDPSKMGPYPFPDNTMCIPNVACFSFLDRQTITYQDNNGYDLTITDIPCWWGPVIVERYRVDDTNDLTLVDSNQVSLGWGEPLFLSATMPAPAVELIVVKSAFFN